jgi:hypothetical protein
MKWKGGVMRFFIAFVLAVYILALVAGSVGCFRCAFFEGAHGGPYHNPWLLSADGVFTLAIVACLAWLYIPRRRQPRGKPVESGAVRSDDTYRHYCRENGSFEDVVGTYPLKAQKPHV